MSLQSPPRLSRSKWHQIQSTASTRTWSSKTISRRKLLQSLSAKLQWLKMRTKSIRNSLKAISQNRIWRLWLINLRLSKTNSSLSSYARSKLSAQSKLQMMQIMSILELSLKRAGEWLNYWECSRIERAKSHSKSTLKLKSRTMAMLRLSRRASVIQKRSRNTWKICKSLEDNPREHKNSKLRNKKL